MATAAKAAFSTRLQAGDGATPTETFTTIAEVRDIDGPALRQLFEEATNMDSPNGWAEHVPTTREAGDVTFQASLLQDNATHARLRSDLNAATLRNYRVLFPPGYTKRISFSAYVQEIGQSFPVKGIQMTPISLKITGQPVLEAHS